MKQQTNSWGKINDGDNKNHILLKAIAIYLTETLNMSKKTGRYELIENPKKRQKSVNDDDEEKEYDPYGYNNEGDLLEKLAIGALPPLNQWIEIEDGVEFVHEINNGNTDNNDSKEVTVKESTITYIFRSYKHDGTKRIDDFVNRAYKSYQEAIIAKHKKDKTRYMYIPAKTTTTSSDDENKEATVPTYKRYGLGEDKTFNSLFFDDKPELLSLLDNFLNKTGKFAIKGFPYKMGLLLHGPPGTGKTSLIKALAQYTKRHIVNISLSKIRTNQELMDAVFDLKFNVAGEDLPVKLSYDKIVFVMEDIDCASNVVNARTDEIKNQNDDGIPDLLAMFEDSSDKIIGPSPKKSSSDRLNLSGLLNVLDGVVDCPGRIVIMTTNHPEKLDPALIRPGRVNKKLLMGHINARQTILMMEHYFSARLDIKQKHEIHDIFANTTKSFSPADVEQLCAEHWDATTMMDALARLGD
ncbi:hypothetical protein THRCLA_08015 [Thraustotheca clavata]|uniref:AAA+ ATPase domain-containing protein n=1 Tax=Thraustotheca clavata TaxID=74557 RepID=A0A1V9ZB28_9STRA|nr:hypothetical protein THRCLA_08015 [Thraustotheca clavata]